LQRTELLWQIQSIIREQLDDASIEVTDTTVVDDVPDWDSIAHVQIMVAIEGRFGVRFEPDEYIDFANVGEMIDCICEKLASGPLAEPPRPNSAADG
jgi:acyl carrier protein